MTRMSKQGERRAKSPHRPRLPMPKTGKVKENLPLGYKPHVNGLSDAAIAQTIFIPKIH